MPRQDSGTTVTGHAHTADEHGRGSSTYAIRTVTSGAVPVGDRSGAGSAGDRSVVCRADFFSRTERGSTPIYWVHTCPE
eukprot:gene13703-biopygen9587